MAEFNEEDYLDKILSSVENKKEKPEKAEDIDAKIDLLAHKELNNNVADMDENAAVEAASDSVNNADENVDNVQSDNVDDVGLSGNMNKSENISNSKNISNSEQKKNTENKNDKKDKKDKKKKKGFFSVVKDVFFESLDDEIADEVGNKSVDAEQSADETGGESVIIPQDLNEVINSLASENQNNNNTDGKNVNAAKDVNDESFLSQMSDVQGKEEKATQNGTSGDLGPLNGASLNKTDSGETSPGGTPASEISASEILAGETPSGEIPAGEIPVSEASAGATPVNELSAGETSDDKIPDGVSDGQLNLSDENERVIAELYGDNGQKQNFDEPPKKGFIAKLRYKLQQIKKKNEQEDIAEQEAEKIELEENQKKKAEKKTANREKKEQKKAEKAQKKKDKAAKPKKEKKVKEKKVKEPPKPGDILKIKPKSIILFLLFISGVILLIELFNSAINYNISINSAQDYFVEGNYDKAFDELSGMNIKNKDKDLYNQITIVMYVQRQYESYQNYMDMNMKPEALDALVKGIKKYDTYYNDATNYGIANEYDAIKGQIVKALQDSFNMSEDQARTMTVMRDSDFTQYYLKIQEYGGNNN